MAKEQFKVGELCTDSMVYKIPDTTDLKKEHAILKDSQTKRALEIEVDTTHGGYVNKNAYFYTSDGQAKGVASFFVPYKKPVLAQHLIGDTPIGRTYAAVFIPLGNVNDSADITKPKSKIRVKSVITDEKAIDYILDGRYLTVSTAGTPKNKPICSICNLQIDSEGCTHIKGNKYDDKLCYWIIGEMEYKEYSFVNVPADSTSEHVASLVGLRFIDVNLADASTAEFNLKDIKETSGFVTDAEGGDKTMKQEGGQIMDKADFEALVAIAFTVLDECKECGDETIVKPEWTDAKEITEAEEADKEFTIFLSILFGDKVLTPEAKKAMNKSTFCGPNRTFPVPDCKHASTAMAYLNFPKVVAKYSASVRARIASCIRSKAKTMNCPMSKSKSDAQVEFDAMLLDAKVTIGDVKKIFEKMKTLNLNVDALCATLDKISSQVAELVTLKADIQQKDSEIKDANTKIEELNGSVRKKVAEKILDLSIISRRDTAKDLICITDVKEYQSKYETMVGDLIKLTVEDLNTKLGEIQKDGMIKIVDFVKITDPTIHDKTMENTDLKNKDKKTQISETKVGKLIFGA